MGRQGSPWRADPGMCPASRGTLGLAMKAKGEVLKPIHPRDPWQVEFRLRRASMSWAPVPAAEIGQLGQQWLSRGQRWLREPEVKQPRSAGGPGTARGTGQGMRAGLPPPPGGGPSCPPESCCLLLNQMGCNSHCSVPAAGGAGMDGPGIMGRGLNVGVGDLQAEESRSFEVTREALTITATVGHLRG